MYRISEIFQGWQCRDSQYPRGVPKTVALEQKRWPDSNFNRRTVHLTSCNHGTRDVKQFRHASTSQSCQPSYTPLTQHLPMTASVNCKLADYCSFSLIKKFT